eukprot:SAG22_NODE_565_length_9046_cov_142.250475_5_plen_74_part_00
MGSESDETGRRSPDRPHRKAMPRPALRADLVEGSALTSLRRLELNANQITDLAPLKSLTSLDDLWIHITRWWL